MTNINPKQLSELITDILQNAVYQPFLCLPLSSLIYCSLLDIYNVRSKLVTGNLMFKNDYIFKQDYSIRTTEKTAFQEWGGHAWVDLNGLIIDLSLFRTLYSDQFTKLNIKHELIKIFGEGRGCIIATPESLNTLGLFYNPINILPDDYATAIIAGYPYLINSRN